MRWASPSRSSYWPLDSAQSSTARLARPITRADAMIRATVFSHSSRSTSKKTFPATVLDHVSLPRDNNNVRPRQPPQEIAMADDWPPVIEEYLDRPPVGHPAQDDEPFIHRHSKLSCREGPCGQATARDTQDQYNKPNQQCISSNAK